MIVEVLIIVGCEQSIAALSLSFESSEHCLCFRTKLVVQTIGKFTRNIKAPSIMLICNRWYGLQPSESPELKVMFTSGAILER